MENVPEWVGYASFYVSMFVAFVALAATMISYTVYAANTSPEVIVHLEQNQDSKTVLNLVVENIGKGAARNVTFHPETPLPQEAFGVEDAPMPEPMAKGPLVNGIPYLAPGSQRKIMLGQYGGLTKWFEDKSISIRVECERTNMLLLKSRRVVTYSSVDIFSFADTDASDNSHAKAIRDELRKLNSEVARLRSQLVQTIGAQQGAAADPAKPRN